VSSLCAVVVLGSEGTCLGSTLSIQSCCSMFPKSKCFNLLKQNWISFSFASISCVLEYSALSKLTLLGAYYKQAILKAFITRSFAGPVECERQLWSIPTICCFDLWKKCCTGRRVPTLVVPTRIESILLGNTSAFASASLVTASSPCAAGYSGVYASVLGSVVPAAG
jgi:hypothetical protein